MMNMSSLRFKLPEPPAGYPATLLLGFIGLYTAVVMIVITLGMVVMNGSHSLPHNGYFMLRWPNVAIKGSYVAFDGPPRYRSLFKDLVFVKKVMAVAGDELRVEENQVCVEEACFPLDQNSGFRGLTLNQATIVPEGHVAVFGTSPDSLDSRYEQIGFVKTQDFVGVGFPVPVPRWQDLKAWTDKWL